VSAPEPKPAPTLGTRLLCWLGIFFAAQVPLAFLLPWQPWYPAVFPIGIALPLHIGQVNNVHHWWPDRETVFFMAWLLFGIHLALTLLVQSWRAYRRLMIFLVMLVLPALGGSFIELKDELLFDRPNWVELPAPAR
jgi:hypothetical protein